MKYPKQSADYSENKKLKKRCLLMYSGGVDTSLSLYLLQKYYGYRVITFCVDVCQNKEWTKQMAKKAKTLGAVKTIVYDGKDEYANKYISQIIKANGFYDDFYPIGTSVARPWQAKLGLEAAKLEKVDAIAHGNKGRGAGAFQFNMVFNFLNDGQFKLVIPIGDWWPSRQDEIEFAKLNKIPLPVSAANPFSYDDNIMSNAINYGDIDSIDKNVPEEAYMWTLPIEKTPDKADIVELEFNHGIPVKVNGGKIKLSELFIMLNKLGGKHGIGRINMIENGLYGNKFKWVYEAPAAQMLIYSHKEIEKLVFPKSTLIFKQNVIDKKWAELVYHAFVYSPLAKALMSFIESVQPYVNGKITLKLFKGNFTVVKRESVNSLVNLDSKNLKLHLDLDELPYGFEEYSFATKHPEVFFKHLGAKKTY